MRVIEDRAALRDARDKLTGRVAVVMTMGALHEGHAALLKAARADSDQVIATIFVNPLQFGPNEDFDRYPRSLGADLAICEAHGVDVVFTPDRATVYPDGEPAVRVNPGPLGEILEGTSRPGFFHGVLTVVLKLLHLTRPDVAYYGEKDYQQLTLIRRMARDLDVPTEIKGVATVREPDGLALSSRNGYLSPDERDAAGCLFLALTEAAELAKGGERDAAALVAAMAREIGATRLARLDYAAVVDEETFVEVREVLRPARALVAARIGSTRLIDNLLLPT